MTVFSQKITEIFFSTISMENEKNMISYSFFPEILYASNVFYKKIGYFKYFFKSSISIIMCFLLCSGFCMQFYMCNISQYRDVIYLFFKCLLYLKVVMYAFNPLKK